MRRRVDRADRAHQAIAVPERDQAPRLAVGAAGQKTGGPFTPAVLGVQPGPSEHGLRGRVAAGAHGADATLGVERPRGDSGGLEHRARLVGDVRNDAHELVTSERGELLDANRLRQCELVGVMEAHGPQGDADHRRRVLEELQLNG